jgi:hypothetical protein
MAKQIGENFITGTYDDLCFYKMDGQYYVRIKSSLTRNRVRKSAAFTRTMQSASELAAASVIASQVYRTIAKEKRRVAWYRKMTGMAKLLFKNGESKERIMELLIKYIINVLKVKPIKARIVTNKRKLFTTVISSRNMVEIKLINSKDVTKKERKWLHCLLYPDEKLSHYKCNDKPRQYNYW